jgi:hypothetical protein
MLTLTEIMYRTGAVPWLILGYPKLNLRLTHDHNCRLTHDLNLRLTLAGTDCREPEIVCHNTI